MSYYTKQQRSTLCTADTGGKKVFQALAASCAINTQATLVEIKDSLAGGKKHSSATLLRNKLRGRLMRELQDI